MFDWLSSALAAFKIFLLQKLLPAALIFAAGFFAIRILMKLLQKAFEKTKFDPPISSLLLSVIRIALYILLSLITASSLGIDVTGLVALASVLTLAVSLSVQDALSNLIGGFTLLYTKPFVIGDFVEIGGESGTVQQIGLTYTKLMTPDRKTVSMPNKTVVAAQIVNYTNAGTRRVDITVQVSYDCNPDVVLEALKKAAQVPTALDTPTPYAAVSSYGDSAIGYLLQVYSTSDNYWTTLHAVNRNIQTVFEQMGVIMTYPHLNVHIEK